jgi:hypothetical protein
MRDPFNESVVVVMPPGCGLAGAHAERLLILVLPLPGYHYVLLPTDPWYVPPVGPTRPIITLRIEEHGPVHASRGPARP